MRLIDVYTFELIEKKENEIIGKYAILSHRWTEPELDYRIYHKISSYMTEEASGLDPKQRERLIVKFLATARFEIHQLSFEKIRGGCKQARNRGLEYLWVDTCCIDKDSGSELNEAIKSMFRWYHHAEVCFTYLHDYDDNLSECEWFKRGWTLQELLAPRRLEFMNSQWISIGSRRQRKQEISYVTKIAVRHLEDFKSASIATRLSWATGRIVTKPEDRVYSLFGICGVDMDIAYGVGEQTEFLRFQTLILKQGDESLFAWRSTAYSTSGLLAPSLDDFADYGDLRSETISDRRRLELGNPTRLSAPMLLVGSAESGQPFAGIGMDKEIDLPLNVINAKGDVVTIRLRRTGSSNGSKTCYGFKRILCHQIGSCSVGLAAKLMQEKDVDITIQNLIKESQIADGEIGEFEPLQRTVMQKLQRSFNMRTPDERSIVSSYVPSYTEILKFCVAYCI